MKLKQLRKNKKLTQQQLADIFKVNQQTIARWESSITEPSIAQIKQLAAFFKITIDDLLQKENTMKHIDTDPYSVITRKNGCEVWVTNENWNLFIGELTNELRYPDQTTDVDNKTIADVMRKAQVICNALNENQMEQM
jgi:transcriptional regulator with XRE-family HTH domain